MTPFLRTSALLLLFAPAVRGADADHFEAKIRPVLVEQCYSCHSEAAEKAKKLKGGLKLDTRDATRKGGDTGPAVVPGKPKEGSLLDAIRYAGDSQMPPKGKLPDAVIADFEKWILDGAADPRDGNETAKTLDIAKGREFWAFQPPKAVTPPKADGAKTDVDRFVFAKLTEKGLKPGPVADKRTLLRRAHLDLTGLPPTPADLAAFEKDTSPEAFAKVVDGLLASPRYGERWGRYWLDVARYAEDQAHTFGVKKRDQAYRYRDWVIGAFNADMPFDQFVKLQLAGDLLPESVGDPTTRLAGLGFLGLGAEYYKNTAAEQAIADELDDRVDTVTRGFLGLTVSCARCHDHKFDPIPTKDYYAIAGIFNGSKFADVPLVSADTAKAFDGATKAMNDQTAAITKSQTEIAKKIGTEAAKDTAKYLDAAVRMSKDKALKADAVAKADQLDPAFLARWVKAVASTAKPLEPIKTALATDAARAAFLEKMTKKDGAVMTAVFTDKDAPFFIPPAEVEKRPLADDDKKKLADLKAELDKRKKAMPPTPPMAHVLTGGGNAMPVYVRGNPANKGPAAPKGFLQVIADKPAAKDFTRLDLANAIADKANPLTARVIVNRVWAWHFGRGLANTPSNFGLLGDRPTHPELLDTLAVQFVENGWSMKWLHRQIVLSATYQASSNTDAENAKTDPANVYLWRGNRHRLDVEAWRDSLLAVAGTIDLTTGGPTFDLKNATVRRRTVYAKISRHELDGLLRLFDFPDANVTADKRGSTTVPQQQLFALNSEFMIGQAKAFAERVEKAEKVSEARIKLAYRLAFTREPTTEELALGAKFVALPSPAADKLTRWQQYAQILLASNELLFAE